MNKMYIISLLLLLFVLIMLIGFFSSAETAYLSLTKIKLRRISERKTKRSKTVAKLKENMERFLTVVLIGTNFLNSLSTAIATMIAVSIFGESGVGIATLVVAFFITVVGQIVPKTIASMYPEKVSLISSEPLLILQKLFYPIVRFFEILSHLAVKLVEKIVKPSTVNITEEEIKTLISVGETEGTIQKKEGQMLNKIIKFNDLVVSDIMKHRSFISMVSESACQEEVISEFLKSGFSSLAVYKQNRENVVGVLNYKTILYNSTESKNTEPFYAKQNMKSIDFVPSTLSVFELLQKFRKSEHKFAVVLNEQGDTYGIVTMEDIMKLVFNRMIDENSYNFEPAENKIKPISPKVFLVQGDILIEDINTILRLKLKSDEFNTFGGWVLEQFGHLPSIGEVFINERVIYMVEDVSKRRIITVRVTIPS